MVKKIKEIKTIHVGIVGSRSRDTDNDFFKVEIALQKILIDNPKIILVSGGCSKGADRFAEELSEIYKIPIIIHYPDKSKLKVNTKWAYAEICYARNTLIANDSDILIACVSSNRKGGTEDTISKYLQLNKTKLILV